MAKSLGIDTQAIADLIAQAGASQGAAVRKAVSQATLQALQGRELTLANMRAVLKGVTEAASAGAAGSGLPAVDVEALLGQAVAGMDSALLQAVQANRVALQRLLDQGVGLDEGRLQAAMNDLEKMEDMFVAAVGKAAASAAAPLQAPWSQVLESMKLQGTDSGAQAAATIEQLMTQAQTAMRDSRSAGLRAAQALADSYSALVSGVLIGLSEGLERGGRTKDAAPKDAPAGGAKAAPAKAAGSARRR